jgi:hypothetical protein
LDEVVYVKAEEEANDVADHMRGFRGEKPVKKMHRIPAVCIRKCRVGPHIEKYTEQSEETDRERSVVRAECITQYKPVITFC